MILLSPNDEIIPGFGFARSRDKAFSAIRELWETRQSQGMTQHMLAERLGKDPAWVSRKLSGPSNWTLRTFGDLADALDGEVEIRVNDLHLRPSRINFDAYSGYGETIQNKIDISLTDIQIIDVPASNARTGKIAELVE